MKKMMMLAVLVAPSLSFAAYSQQGYYNNQPNYQGYDYNQTQSQPYYQSQGNTYYQTQPGYQTQDGYYQTQPQGQYYNQGGYISQSETVPSVTVTPQAQPVQVQVQPAQVRSQLPQQDTASTEQDKQINAKIRDKLKSLDIKGYETIILRTQNGIVMITGSVDKVDDLLKIRDHVKSVEGVKTINNQVTAKTK